MRVEMESVSHTETMALESIEKKIRPSIYRVHEHLRDLNKKAYELDIVAIGPYHRGKDRLKMMEEHKLRYRESLLLRKPGVKIESFVSAVEQREQEARNCCAESVSLDQDEFIEMLVLDGCFIIELIKRCNDTDSTTYNDDPIFRTMWFLPSVARDLMLFENQIPFVILADFFDLIKDPNQHDFRPVDSVLDFFESLHPGKNGINKMKSKSQDVKHILELLHMNWSQYSSDDSATKNTDSNVAGAVERNRGMKRILDLLHCNWSHSSDDAINLESNTAGGDGGTNNCGSQKRLLDLLHFNWSHSIKEESNSVNSESLLFIPSASELRDSNVKFQMKESGDLLGIEFAKGTMSMAPLEIGDHTDCIFRNLIAYEQYFPDARQTPFTDYHKLLDCLINSSTDVEILRGCKIIENWLGDNEAVVRVVNGLGDSVVYRNSSPYANTYNDINIHCQKRWNRAMAILKRDYFNSPWAIVSVIAAFLLLILTAAQTVLAAIQLP